MGVLQANRRVWSRDRGGFPCITPHLPGPPTASPQPLQVTVVWSLVHIVMGQALRLVSPHPPPLPKHSSSSCLQGQPLPPGSPGSGAFGLHGLLPAPGRCPLITSLSLSEDVGPSLQAGPASLLCCHIPGCQYPNPVSFLELLCPRRRPTRAVAPVPRWRPLRTPGSRFPPLRSLPGARPPTPRLAHRPTSSVPASASWDSPVPRSDHGFLNASVPGTLDLRDTLWHLPGTSQPRGSPACSWLPGTTPRPPEGSENCPGVLTRTSLTPEAASPRPLPTSALGRGRDPVPPRRRGGVRQGPPGPSPCRQARQTCRSATRTRAKCYEDGEQRDPPWCGGHSGRVPLGVTPQDSCG